MALHEHPHVQKVIGAPRRGLQAVGDHGLFYVRALSYTHRALVSYKREVVRLIAEIGMGTGALAVIGGSVAVVGFMLFAGGVTVTVVGVEILSDLGAQALVGFFSAFINVRIAVPFVAGMALSATVGAGATAQLGAMRISEEIDALEVMGIRSMPYLVTTRIIAGFVAIIPIYSVALVSSFVASKVNAVYFYGQSEGAYDHYFFTFLVPIDIFYSFIQAVFMAIVVMLIHTFYGYTATGGPVGVGEAVGKSVRASLVAVTMVALLVAMAVWGNGGGFNLSG